MTYTVKTREEAWELANKLFPTDYEKEEHASQKAGYPIYWSTAAGTIAWISDLNVRLEVNVRKGKYGIESTNIYIDDTDEYEDIEVEVVSGGNSDTEEKRTYKTYAEFLKEMRFFMSGGKIMSDEDSYEKMIKALRDLDTHMAQMTVTRFGLKTTFTYKKF